jgi:menaquinone-dependent protoporphyrinogen oxidase
VARVLVLYSSREGQTARIAARLADRMRGHRIQVEVRDASLPEAADHLASFDGVVIGAAIHYAHHAKEIGEFVKSHRAILHTRHSAFYSVSLSAGGPSRDVDAAKGYLAGFFADTGWTPDQSASFAGAIRHSRYGFLKTMLVHLTVRKGQGPEAGDHEYTDWKAVEAFADGFARRVATPRHPGR